MQDSAVQNKDIYKTSRLLYIIEAAFEYFISILTTGAYLAKLTTSIGISDSTTAVLSTLGSIAASCQLISIFLAHKTPVKRWVIPILATYQLMLSTLYLIPFMNLGRLTGAVFFAIILSTSILSNIISPIKSTWFVNLIDPKKRGLFSAVLVNVSLFGGIIFTLVTSLLLDKYESQNNIEGAFKILTVTILVLSILHISSLIFLKEKPTVTKKHEKPLAEIKNLSKNKKFTSFIFLHVSWAAATCLSASFYGTYQIGELGLSMTFISFINIAVTLLQMIVLYLFGKYSVRHAYLPIIKIAYPANLLTIIVMVFTMPKNGVVMYVIYRAIGIIANASTSVANNFIYQLTSREERTAAIAVNTMATGLTTFFVTLAATPLFNYLKNTLGSTLFGRTIYAQQTLSAISAVLCTAIVVYIFTRFSRTVKSTPDVEEEDEIEL